MGFNLRRRFKLGPIFVNTRNGRITSWGFKLGRLSRNVTRRSTTVDTPGPGSYTYHHKRKR